MFQTTPTQSIHSINPTLPVPLIKILVLEDCSFDQRRLERMVRDSGLSMTIDFVASLEALNTSLDQSRFDIVFLDYNLPIGSGCDAFDIVKTHELNANCAIIMLAGSGRIDHDQKQLRQNCDNSLSKEGLTPDLLRTAVLDILSGLIPRKAFHTEHSQPIIAEVTPKTSIETDIEAIIRDLRYLRMSAIPASDEASEKFEQLEQRAIQTWTKLRQQGTERGRDNKFQLHDLADKSHIQIH